MACLAPNIPPFLEPTLGLSIFVPSSDPDRIVQRVEAVSLYAYCRSLVPSDGILWSMYGISHRAIAWLAIRQRFIDPAHVRFTWQLHFCSRTTSQ
ncbi:hypothetical protein DOTSEDRAFT_70911 [Dothistroma septosporum NZE10]|uniref:Uncharacterized protein n=1 Tax=Dothistroma septosporum (strain NZE10 / CBS 128990) TaxID=675120 RepID=N1PRH3_DOTSN|nr:hypothetical protein DOTSEDRAFT_70911 [Dothistroma septosporum NZE10]